MSEIKLELDVDKATEFIRQIVFVRIKQNVESVSNQGQAMDGYSALANYNDIADRIISECNVK